MHYWLSRLLNQEEKIFRYLCDNNLLDTFSVLNVSKTNMHVRTYILQKALDDFEFGVTQTFSPESKEAEVWIMKVQSMQLEVLAKIFMIFEDFITHSEVLRNRPSQLSKVIASKENIFLGEIEYLQNINSANLWDYFYFPTLDNWKLSYKEKRVLKRILNRELKIQKKHIKNITKFWKNHYPIYNKYKHRFSILLGMHQLNDSSVYSHIYARSIEKINRNSRNSKIYTYIIPVGLVSFQYYQEIALSLLSVMQFLLKTTHQYHSNCGERFFPDIPFKNLLKDEVELLNNISDKKNFQFININLNMQIDFSAKRVKISKKFIKNNHIYKAPIDVFKKNNRIKLNMKRQIIDNLKFK